MDEGDERNALTIWRTLKLYLTNPKRAWLNEKRAWGLRTSHHELLRLGAAQMYDETPHLAYRPDWADLLNIYKLVRRRKPKVVIEFGSGCSTLMFAKALADNQAAGDGAGHLYSVETSAHFKAFTESYFPAALKPFTDILHSDVAFGEMGGEKVMWHTKVPDVVPNLVYLDGPDYHDFSADVEIQADGVRLESRAPEDFAILIDFRYRTFKFTCANLKHRYKTTVSPVHHWELLEREPVA